MLSVHSTSPAIHQRQLATAVWLRTGLNDSGQEVPRRYLLAACERVLELKQNVVDQVRIVARSLTTEKAEQLDLLLTQDRSTQILMDKTLGTSQVVSASNIEGIIDVMKQSLVRDIEEEAAAKITAAQKEAESKIRKAHEGRRTAEKRAAALGDSLSVLSIEDRNLVDRLVADVNGRLKRRKRTAKFGIALLIFLIGTLPLFAESVSGLSKFFALAITGALAATFAFFQILDRPLGLERFLESWGRRKLRKLAADRGIAPKVDRQEIAFSTHGLHILNSNNPEELSL